MSEHLQHFIADYGYWAMFIGALIEGETFLLAGGIAAKHGLLGLPGLIAFATVGAYIHDNVFFLLGRYGGHWVLNKKPTWRQPAERATKLFRRYGLFMVVACRFLYGIRTIVPTVIGMSYMPFWLFTLVSALGALLWSVSFIVGGYLFGELLQVVLKQAHGYESWLFFGILALVVMVMLVVGILYFRKRCQRNSNRG